MKLYAKKCVNLGQRLFLDKIVLLPNKLKNPGGLKRFGDSFNLNHGFDSSGSVKTSLPLQTTSKIQTG